MSHNDRRLHERVGEAANVLLLASAGSDVEDRVCIDLLTLGDAADAAVLSVSFGRSPADRLAVWERHADGYPPRAAIVAADGNGSESEPTDEALRESVPSSTSFAVDRVDDPADLLEVGVRVSERFSGWSGSGHQIVMCLFSLDRLMGHTTVERAYRFLHVITHRVAEVDGVAHYHLDPDAHDPAAIELLETLFDVTVEVDSSGEIAVRS